MKRMVFWIILTLLLVDTIFLAFYTKSVGATGTTVYISSDGSVVPSSAPISSPDNVTYTLTGDISYPTYNGIVVQRGNVIIDGKGYTVQGNQSAAGFYWTGIDNVTIKNVNIQNFQNGIYFSSSSNNIISGNNATANHLGLGIVLDSSSDNNTISGNNLTANDWGGITLWSSCNNTISGNNVTANSGDGIQLHFLSNNNTVSGNTATNNSIGISLSNSTDNSISGNNITKNKSNGIFFSSSSNNSISRNNITANEWHGICLQSSSNYNSIDQNNMTLNAQCGICLISSNNNTVSMNRATANNASGIQVDLSSSNNTVSENTATNNVGCGIFVSRTSNYNTVSGNNMTANGWAGIQLNIFSNYNSVSGNTATANINSGIRLESSSDNTVTGNTVIDNEFFGIDLWNASSYNTLSGNNATANGAIGIVLSDSSNNNAVSGNTAANNMYIGIYLDSSSSSDTVSGNTLTENAWGVYLDASSYNTVIGNTAKANTEGIWLNSSSTYNTVSGNTATANSGDGILLGSSSNHNSITGNNITNNGHGISFSGSPSNSVYHNCFINNTSQVFFSDPAPHSINVWDEGYPSGGNYWSDYNGTDLFSGPYQNVTGSDDIGDKPYVIDDNNTDHYPLFQPWTGPTPTSTYITLSVSLVSVGTLVNCTATVSGVNATGTVTWSSSSSTGNFNTSVCNMSSGNCSTTYIDSCPGSVIIAAWYSGDSNYLPSSASVILTVVSSGPVYYSKNYSSVQAAIDNATPGSTVIVAAGTYSEHLVVNKTLTILGEKDDPVFGGGGSGIFLTLLSGASGSIITGIVITNYVEGILFVNASNCKIYADIMSCMGDSGILLEGSSATGNVVYDNVFQDTPTPINLAASAGGNTVYSNIISSQATVTLTIGTNGNSLYENVISANTILLNMTGSMGNNLYHNDFLATVQVTAAGTNTWDSGYPSGGNYWSDYQTKYPGATQIDSSGIWNTPYVLNSNNRDGYPLVKAYTLAVGHDVAVAGVVTAKTVIGLGFTCNVTVNAVNRGEYTESFQVTAYATVTGTNTIVIGTQQVNNLKSVCPVTLTFTWNTNGLARGNYTVSAYAQPVQAETDVADNTFTGGLVKVTIPGDVNGNFRVTMDDIMLLINAFGSRTGQPRYSANLDITSAGRISMDDIMIAVNHFGQHYP